MKSCNQAKVYVIYKPITLQFIGDAWWRWRKTHEGECGGERKEDGDERGLGMCLLRILEASFKLFLQILFLFHEILLSL